MIHVSRDGSYYAVMVYIHRGKSLRIEKSTGNWDVIDFLCGGVASSRECCRTSICRGICNLAWQGNPVLSCYWRIPAELAFAHVAKLY